MDNTILIIGLFIIFLVCIIAVFLIVLNNDKKKEESNKNESSEDNMKEQSKKIKLLEDQIKEEPEKQSFLTSLIRIKIPSLKLKNYKILVNDLICKLVEIAEKTDNFSYLRNIHKIDFQYLIHLRLKLYLLN